jgi:hypothetical protein
MARVEFVLMSAPPDAQANWSGARKENTLSSPGAAALEINGASEREKKAAGNELPAARVCLAGDSTDGFSKPCRTAR